MIKFTDRKGTSINDKILEVKNVERNESGEIIRLEVKEIRNDKVGIIEEGTALNAAQLNEIVDLIYKNAIMQDKERVNNDLNELSVDSKVNTNFKLKTRGEHGSTISWEVISGTGITISGDNAIVTRELYDQNVTIKATITFNNISQDKTFEVTVSKKETTDSDRVNNDLNELSINTVMSNNILLPSKGRYDSTFNWTVITGTGIDIQDNYAYITRDYVNRYATIQVTATYNSYSNTKRFDIVIPALELDLEINPSNLEIYWTQTVNYYNAVQFTIYSEKKIPDLRLEVEAHSLLTVEIINNNSQELKFNIRESVDLNQAKEESSKTILLPFEFKIYFASNYNNLVKTYNGNIHYTYTKVLPSD